MNNIETLEVDGLKGDQKAEALERELEASAETGLSKAQLVEIFNPNNLEDIIDNQAAEIHDLEKDIERLGEKAKIAVEKEVKTAIFDKISLLVSLKALKIEKIQKWSAIQDSVKAGDATQESLDSEIARIEVLNIEIQEKIDQIKAETK